MQIDGKTAKNCLDIDITAFLQELSFPTLNATLAVSLLEMLKAGSEKLHFRGRKLLFQSGRTGKMERGVVTHLPGLM